MILTERQKAILLAIIEEYMKNAHEVGSAQLVKNYDMPVSSATVRNEMMKLMDMGYLDQTHVSAGRQPTDLALRLYVNEKGGGKMKESIRLVKIRQGIFRVRFYPEQLLKEILKQLVDNSGSASFVVLDDLSRYYGVSSLMKYEELQNIKALQRILDLLEDEHMLKNVFSKYDGDEVTLLIGKELGIRDLEDCTLAFTKIDFWDKRSGHIGIVGSRRMDYKSVIPVLKAVRESVDLSLRGWK